MSVIEIQDLGLTKQREVVLQVIRNGHEHLRAGDIFDPARRLLSNIWFATVYSSLRIRRTPGTGGAGYCIYEESGRKSVAFPQTE
jgi:Fe2+ or Zn2+ uptake regulation protein